MSSIACNSFSQELSKSLEKYQYKLEDFKPQEKRSTFKKFISPSQDISDVKRVQTEI